MNYLQFVKREFEPKFLIHLLVLSLLSFVVHWFVIFPILLIVVYLSMDYYFYQKETKMFDRFEAMSKMRMERYL